MFQTNYNSSSITLSSESVPIPLRYRDKLWTSTNLATKNESYCMYVTVFQMDAKADSPQTAQVNDRAQRIPPRIGAEPTACATMLTRAIYLPTTIPTS